ncbi:MAG TPA: ATP-binding protein [Vicinamibacterales bacterium]|nr:ATP-binding protein [Vicinamibacterales bacterium]
MAAVTEPIRNPIVFRVSVAEHSDVSEARRLARSAAADVGFSEADAERVAIVATEASTNLVKHAEGGEVIVRTRSGVTGGILEILAVDRGPGMANLAECLRDGYTTTGTRGNGLGAIVRQSDGFDAYSRAGRGTVILSRIRGSRVPARDANSERRSRIRVDGLSLHKQGEEVCGDSWAWLDNGSRVTILVVDGLGHGLIAADAATEAVSAFRDAPETTPAETLDRIHRALLKTRGAAVSVAQIDAGRGTIAYAGIGNIAATVENGGAARHLVSHHGIVGHHIRRVQDFMYPWTQEDVLVMHSDGVNAHWSFDKYPGLAERDPLVIAAVLLRDFSRGRDDATVVVARMAADASRRP